MKTTVTITVEKVEDGHRIKINHEGDQLDLEACSHATSCLNDYWQGINWHADAKENLVVMKQKRKDMKGRIQHCASQIEKYQSEGMMIEKPEPDSIPF